MEVEFNDAIINAAIRQHSVEAREDKTLKLDAKSKLPRLNEINGGSANIRDVINAAFWDQLTKCAQETNQYAAAGTYGQCAYCMRPLAGMKTDGLWYLSSNNEAQMDHLYPASMGWPAVPGAIVLACKDCNSKKSDQDPEEFLKIIHSSPEKLAGLPDAIKSVEAHWRFLEKNYKDKAIAWVKDNGDDRLIAMIEWATGVRKMSNREAYTILDKGILSNVYDPSIRKYGYSIPIQDRLDAKAIAAMFWEPSTKNNSMNLSEFVESIPPDHVWGTDRTANEELVLRLGRIAAAKDDAMSSSSHNINYKKLRRTLEDYYNKLSKYYGISQDLLPALPISRRAFDLMDERGAFDLPGWSGELLSWVNRHNDGYSISSNKTEHDKPKKPVLDDVVDLEVEAARAKSYGKDVRVAVSTFILNTLLSIPSDDVTARSTAQSRASRMVNYADSRWGSIIDSDHLKMTAEALSSKWPGIAYLWSVAKQGIDNGKKSPVYAWSMLEKQIVESGMESTMDEVMSTGNVESIKKIIATVFKINYCNPSDGLLKRDNNGNAIGKAYFFRKTITELLQSVWAGSQAIGETMRFYKTCSILGDHEADLSDHEIGLSIITVGHLESWFNSLWDKALKRGLKFSQSEKDIAANASSDDESKTMDDLRIIISGTWKTVINKYEDARAKSTAKTKPQKFNTLLNRLYGFRGSAINNKPDQKNTHTIMDTVNAWAEVRRVLELDEIHLADVESLLDSSLSLARLASTDKHARSMTARSLNSLVEAIVSTGLLGDEGDRYLRYKCGYESNAVTGLNAEALEEQYGVDDVSKLPDPSYADVLRIPNGNRGLDDVLCDPSVSIEEKLTLKWCDCVLISNDASWVVDVVRVSRIGMPSFSAFVGQWFDLPGLLRRGEIRNTEFVEAFKRVYHQKVDLDGKTPSSFKDDWNIMMAMFKTLALKAINVVADDETLSLFPSYDELMLRRATDNSIIS